MKAGEIPCRRIGKAVARLVSVQEDEEALGVSCATVRRKVKAGEIPHRRIGKAVRIDISKLRALDAEEVEAVARHARCSSAHMRELDRHDSSRTDFRL